MPPEVLGEIFSWTLPSVDECLEREQFPMTDSPWLLTHIDRCWRAVAVSTPSLWSLVALSYPDAISMSRGRDSDCTRPKAEDTFLWLR
ncbi:hypothetical protein B0H19DRAFT_483800, partial [Mycena capillaripes]